MKKKLISLLLVLALVVGICPAAFAVESRTYSTGAPRGLLLYVGSAGSFSANKYPTYTQSDIKKLSQATTEFVLCSGNALYNTYKFGNSSSEPIITESLINNMSSSLVANPASLENIKQDYLALLTGARMAAEDKETSHIENLFCHLDPARYSYVEPSKYFASLFGRLDPVRYSQEIDPYIPLSFVESRAGGQLLLDDLATDVIALVNTIVAAEPNATIWLPFPNIFFPSFGAEYVTPFTLYVNNLRSNLGTIWTTNIRGFYWGTESVEQYYTPFNYSSNAANGFGNPMVQLMNSMDSLLSGYSKQFLWIPYLGETETLKRGGYVVNRTNIFDYALFQPSYYFTQSTTNYNNLALIKKSVQQNKLYNRSNAVIGGSKSGTTTIGYEMEINDKIIQQAYNDRYWEYTNQFAAIKTGYPCMFYAGDRNQVCGTDSGATTCFYYVKTWLAS